MLDPFCGCGTTIHAAQKLGRQWIGIDVTYLAINLIKRRLKDAFGEEIKFEEKGQPTDFAGAKQLAGNDKFQFQHWALSLIGARPLREGDGKGADRGVDGLLYFYETKRTDISGRIREDIGVYKGEPVHREKIIVQVKGGGVNRGDVATLLGDVKIRMQPAAFSSPSKNQANKCEQRQPTLAGTIQALARRRLSAHPSPDC